MSAERFPQYRSISQARRLSKSGFGAAYRLEVLLSIASLEDRWSRSDVLDRVTEQFPDFEEDDVRPMAASSLHKELKILEEWQLVRPTQDRDSRGELLYTSPGATWVYALAADIGLEEIAEVVPITAEPERSSR